MVCKRALILGVGGQDGSYLAELLLSKHYDVYGLYRKSSADNLTRIAHIKDKLTLVKGDMTDGGSVDYAIRECQPDQIFNLADQDSIGWSEYIPAYNLDVTAGAVCRLLESVRRVDKAIRVFQPVSAYILDDTLSPQNEQTRIAPKNVYACAKACALYLCRHYRERYGVQVSVGIMYNHDSPRRRGRYLLQTICRGVLECATTRGKKFNLGSLTCYADVGFAGDYVDAMHRVTNLDNADDWVIGSGRVYQISELVRITMDAVGDSRLVGDVVDVDDTRSGNNLSSDITAVKSATGWEPKTPIEELIRMILEEISDKRLYR